MEVQTGQREYLSCAETAKLVRSALKREFPGVKFSVRSDTYAGGASIDVRWTDGPTADQVGAITDQFRGADFDGMIDLKSYTEHWLLPDGTAKVAHRQGTHASRGTIPEQIGDPGHADARLVHFGADYIHTYRELSPEWRAELEAEIAAAAGEPFGDDKRMAVYVDRETGEITRWANGEEWGSTLVHRVSAKREGPRR